MDDNVDFSARHTGSRRSSGHPLGPVFPRLIARRGRYVWWLDLPLLALLVAGSYAVWWLARGEHEILAAGFRVPAAVVAAGTVFVVGGLIAVIAEAEARLTERRNERAGQQRGLLPPGWRLAYAVAPVGPPVITVAAVRQGAAVLDDEARWAFQVRPAHGQDDVSGVEVLVGPAGQAVFRELPSLMRRLGDRGTAGIGQVSGVLEREYGAVDLSPLGPKAGGL